MLFPFTALVFVFYGILNHGPLKKYQIQDLPHKEAQYKQLSSSLDNSTNNRKSHPQWIGRLQFFSAVLPYFGYYFVNYCAYFLAVSSVLTTLSFPSSPFRIRDHYHYYRLVGDVGMVLGGSERMVVSCLCPSWLKFLRIRKLWILVLLNVSHLMVFLFASWYHFVPNVYIVLFLSGTHGLVFGSTAVHVVVAAADKFQNSHMKGLSLNITHLGCSLGRLASGLLGIYVEEYLRKHCTNSLLMGRYCLARFDETVGWSQNFHCHGH